MKRRTIAPGPLRRSTKHRMAGSQRGFALIGAIGLLALFVLLGTAYVRYMMLELEDTRGHVDEVRAEHLASGGIYAALGELGAALAEDRTPASSLSIKANIYRYEGGNRVAYEQEIHVAVSDESGRINVNHASPELLAAIGMSAEAIEKIHKAVPTPSGLRSESRRWLNNVDDLLTRGLVNRREFERLDTARLTTYSIENHTNPVQFLNINSAEPEVLAAVFGIDNSDEIAQLIAKRPFSDWQDAVTKSGREPSTFNVKSPRYASREMPPALTLRSKCFRIYSEVTVNYPGASRRAARAAVEAVVLFKDDGSYAIRFWNEQPLMSLQGNSPEVDNEAQPHSPEDDTHESTP